MNMNSDFPSNRLHTKNRNRATPSRIGLAKREIFALVSFLILVSGTIKASAENPVAQLIGFVKYTAVETVNGCKQLYTNHQKCNGIRKQIKEYHLKHNPGVKNTNSLPIMGITFAEYNFLQQGKADRGKVFNLIFLSLGAPKFLPYALLFNPDMLPTPLKMKAGNQGTLQRRPTFTALPLLIQLEDRIVNPPENPIGKLMFWTKKEKETRRNFLLKLREEAFANLESRSRGFSTGAVYPDASLFTSDTPISRADQRLCQLPPQLISSISQVLSGGKSGFLSGLTPNFMTRGNICSHLNQINEADDFLRNNQVNLTSVDDYLIQKTCADRWIESSSGNVERMRDRLDLWLETTHHNTTDYYNQNLHKLSLMGINALQAIQEDCEPPTLTSAMFSRPLIEAPKRRWGR